MYLVITLLIATSILVQRAVEGLLCDLITFGLIALLQYQLLHLAHEVIHQRKLSTAWPRKITNFVLLFPLGLSDSFRREHLSHHKNLGNPQLDPDYPTVGHFPKSRLEFIRLFVKSLVGISALSQVTRQLKKKDHSRNALIDSLQLAIVQILLLILFASVLGLSSYFTFWLLPLVTVVKVLTQARGLAEHGNPNGGQPILRSFECNGVFSRFIGSFGFRYHSEHHLFPSIPFKQLRVVRARLLTAGIDIKLGETSFELAPSGYLVVLTNWFRSLPWK